MRRAALLTAVLSLCVSLPAEGRTGRQLEAEAGIGQLDDEWLLSTRLAFYLFDEVGGVGCEPTEYGGEMAECTAPVGIGLQLPLRFDLQGSDVVHREDWDEPGDFFRIARFLEYGKPHQPLHARFGELGGVVLGHGTIANGYLNTVTSGDFNPGFEASANTAYGGLHLFLGNITDPYLFGARGFVRPWAWRGRDSYWHRLAIGVSSVSDFSAPTRTTANVGVRRPPIVVESTAVTVAGVDVELLAVESDALELAPYADLNFSQGLGYHFGANTHLLIHEHWSASVRLEGRVVGPGYLPDYFGPLYEVDRFRMAGWDIPLAVPKAVVAASRQSAAYGGFAQVGVSWREYASLAVAASDHSGGNDTSGWLRLTVTPPGPFSMGVYWAKQNTEFEDFLELNRTLLASEARLTVWGPIYLHGRYDRLFRISPSGLHAPAEEWSAGVGAVFPLTRSRPE